MRQLFSHRDASMSTFRCMSIGMEALQFIFFIQGSDPSTRIWTFLKAEMFSFYIHARPGICKSAF